MRKGERIENDTLTEQIMGSAVQVDPSQVSHKFSVISLAPWLFTQQRPDRRKKILQKNKRIAYGENLIPF